MIYIINPASRKHKEVMHTLDQPSLRLPYGPAVLTSYLKKKGFNTVLVDLRQEVKQDTIKKLNDEDIINWVEKSILTENLKKYFEECLRFLPNLQDVKIIGFSIFSYMEYGGGIALAKHIKTMFPDIIICAGGPHMTIKKAPRFGFIDYVVQGFGNKPFEHIANHVLNNGELDLSFPGLSIIKDGDIISNKPNIEVAEEEEMPDFTDLDLKKYIYNYSKNDRVLAVPYRINIGCHNACSFCAFRLGYGYSYKSVDKVVKEMVALNQLHEHVYFAFADCTTTNNLAYLNNLLDEMIAQKLNVRWQACANIDKVSEELLDKMAKAGCKRIYWGFEHFSPKMQKIYNKTFDIKSALKFIKITSAKKIESEISFIFNGPLEEMEDLNIQSKYIKKVLCFPKVVVRNYFFKLNENTLMYKKPAKYGIEILSEPSPFEETIRWEIKNMSEESSRKRMKEHDNIRQQLTILNDLVIKVRKNFHYIPVSLIMPLLVIISRLYFRVINKEYM